MTSGQTSSSLLQTIGIPINGESCITLESLLVRAPGTRRFFRVPPKWAPDQGPATRGLSVCGTVFVDPLVGGVKSLFYDRFALSYSRRTVQLSRRFGAVPDLQVVRERGPSLQWLTTTSQRLSGSTNDKGPALRVRRQGIGGGGGNRTDRSANAKTGVGAIYVL